MLRTTLILCGGLLIADAQAADTALDFAQVCHRAASEPAEMRIDDRIVGYCTTAIGQAASALARSALLTNRAILETRRDNWQAARTDLDDALAASPDNAAAWVTLGYVNWQSGNLPAAENNFTRALELAPLPVAAKNRSIVRRLRGDLDGAMQDALLAAGRQPPPANSN
ncbi:MAG: tetratricopeptide repeat protein [Pseudomonadales bacterium]|nr:tetratricopeptide repeat protein [Pseudomonadales bacterium]MCP5184089.1 tetratricopeptide repeat protein [Pseudomonadales bacterium]